MTIRRAKDKDVPAVLRLLSQVLEIHAAIRPDIFISGSTKYSDAELRAMFADEEKPVYVAVNDADEVLGYAVCCVRQPPFASTMRPRKSLFIDDLCVDEACRGQRIGEELYRFVVEQAKRKGCAAVTLNVWEGNDAAMAFYRKMGMQPKETQMEYRLDQ